VYVRRRPPTGSLAPPDERSAPARVVNDLGRNLRSVQAEVARMIQQCQQLLDGIPNERTHRDVLHLRARIQGIEQCTRDAEQTLARLRSRAPVGEVGRWKMED
jgi:hypothetical protein